MLAALVRFLFNTADPPWAPGVGVTWHDEGAWVHNARNRALFGAWSLDAWNPMYLNPVFTGLEYLSFAAFGVGLRQARLVSQVAGVAAVVLLGLGVARLGSRRAGLMAALLLATSYVAVMYDRAALMESSMTAWLVLAWWAYARAATSPRWGLVAGLAALLAFFTKASAVFFIAALALEAVLSLVLGRSRTPGFHRSGPQSRRRPCRRVVLDARGPRVRCAAGIVAVRRPALGRIPFLQLRDVDHP